MSLSVFLVLALARGSHATTTTTAEDLSGSCACIYQGQRLSESLYNNYPSSEPGKYQNFSAINLYGTMCAAWDQMKDTPWYSYCTEGPWDGDNNWCQNAWCYVGAGCATKVPSSVFAGSSTAFYSYETCGAPDCYTTKDGEGCPHDPTGMKTYMVHKGGDCACAYQGQVLATEIYTDYPLSDPGKHKDKAAISSYGTTCAAWDQSPDTPWYSYCPAESDFCKSDFNWCQAPWCYVSESCSTKVASSVFQGSPVAFYSYDTCGAPDCYANAYDDNTCNMPSACPFDTATWYTAGSCSSGFTDASCPATTVPDAVTTAEAATVTTAEAATAETVSGSFTVSGVSYDDVTSDTQVEADFKSACASSIAANAGSGVVASMVTVTLSAGSVKIDFSITLPAGMSGSTVSTTLTTASTGGALLTSLSNSIGDISTLTTTGSIGVTGFTSAVDDTDTEEPSDKASHAGVSILSAVALAALAGLRA